MKRRLISVSFVMSPVAGIFERWSPAWQEDGGELLMEVSETFPLSEGLDVQKELFRQYAKRLQKLAEDSE
jgi:hypothetical protein